VISSFSERPNRSNRQTTRVSPARSQSRVRSRPLRGATGLVGEDFLASGLFQRILLQMQLLILGRHPGVADEHRKGILSGGSKETRTERQMHYFDFFP